MATNRTILASIRIRSGTGTDWATDPILKSGELGYNSSLNTKKMKIGDGTTKWSLLPFLLLENRKINGKELSSDITLSASDIGAISEEVDDLESVTNRSNITLNTITTAGYKMGTSTLGNTKATMQYNETTESIEFIFS